MQSEYESEGLAQFCFTLLDKHDKAKYHAFPYMNYSMKCSNLNLFILIALACFSMCFGPAFGLAGISGKDQVYAQGVIAQTRDNMDRAVHFFQEAAGEGYDMAQYSLGEVYYYGKGVDQNYLEAFKWYLLAAKQGNVAAQVAVGAMYAKGRGIKQDYAEANRWFFSAGNKGNAFAQYNMGTAYEHGLGIQKDETQAFKWFLRAAGNGIAQAQLIVGNRYAEGRGTRQDSVKAYFWANKAADQELSAAITARDEMAKTLTPARLRQRWMKIL